MNTKFQSFAAGTFTAAAAVTVMADNVVEIGSRLEPFVDRYLIDTMDGVELRQKEWSDRGNVLSFNAPWEGPFSGYVTIIKDGDLYRAYYRGGPGSAGPEGEDAHETTCYAESTDGINWTKPDLGLHKVNGTSDNNVILYYPETEIEHAPTHNFSPMLDANPDAEPSERFKALGGTEKGGGLFAYASADGVRWEKMRADPVFSPTGWVLDSQNVSFWSEKERKYVLFYRHTIDELHRAVARSESSDHLNWSEGTLMQYTDTQSTIPRHQLYTNQTHPYFRAPHLYIATPARFMEGQQVLTEEQAKQVGVHPEYFKDTSDCIFLVSRDGLNYSNELPDSLVRPGIGLNNWVSRTNYPALNIVETGEHEMSLYIVQDYGQPTAHLRRYSQRTDGFAALEAPLSGGEVVTRPITFTGDRLALNLSTSAAGSVLVELQNADGVPIPGYSLEESVPMIGNDLAKFATWESRPDGNVSELVDTPVRLRFALKDASLFAIQFVPIDNSD